jgi:hypothetical protein
MHTVRTKDCLKHELHRGSRYCVYRTCRTGEKDIWSMFPSGSVLLPLLRAVWGPDIVHFIQRTSVSRPPGQFPVAVTRFMFSYPVL